MGCLPYGSGNDFLRTYGTRAEFTDLDAQLAGGEVTIDLLETSLGLSATICAAGLDAQVAYGIPKFRRIPLCGGDVIRVQSLDAGLRVLSCSSGTYFQRLRERGFIQTDGTSAPEHV